MAESVFNFREGSEPVVQIPSRRRTPKRGLFGALRGPSRGGSFDRKDEEGKKGFGADETEDPVMDQLRAFLTKTLGPGSTAEAQPSPFAGNLIESRNRMMGDFLAGGDAPSIDEFGAPIGIATETARRESPTGEQGPGPGTAGIEDALKKSEDLLAAQESLNSVEIGTLTPADQAALQDVRANIERALLANAAELKRAQAGLRVQDLMFQVQAEQLGADIDVSALSEALDNDQGIGLETVNAIMGVLEDDTLTKNEQKEMVDLLADRFTFGGEILREVETLVQNEQDLKTIQKLPDADLLGDEADYMQPLFSNSLIFDTVERMTVNYSNAFDLQFPDFDATGNPQAIALWEKVMTDALSGGIDESDPAVVGLAQIMGIPIGTLVLGVSGAARPTLKTEESIKKALSNPDRLEPGSEDLMYAAQNAAIEANMAPGFAQLFANSKALHAIIKVKSNGRAGEEGPGTIRGIGGLTEEMYEVTLGKPWSPDLGMHEELKALAIWIAEAFDGRITDAIDWYYRTGDWGGVAALQDRKGQDALARLSEQGA